MKSISLNDLVHFCNTTLAVDQFKDYAPNGLQVEGRGEVSRLITGVTASKNLIEAAIACQADAILVHHGYFWKGEPEPLVGMKGARIKLLMQHNISLLAYHLPLDAHPTLGNNIALAEALGFNTTGGINPLEKHAIGNMGNCAATTAAAMTLHIEKTLGRTPLHLSGGPDMITRIAWCSGGAEDLIHKAAAQGCHAYLSGEVSERTAHEAAELGIHYFACGHHATEKGGVTRMASAIKQALGIDTAFIDMPISV